MTPLLKSFKKDIPPLFFFRNRVLLVAFVFLYALFFINIYEPFNINEWGQEYYWNFTLVGCGILLITQFIFHFVFKSYRTNLYSVLLYCIFEVSIIALIFFLLENAPLNTFNEKLQEYFLTLRYTSLVIMVPYLLFLWYIQLRVKISGLKKIEETVKVNANKLITISEENGKVLLAIKPKHLVYVKSAGNYLELFYLKGDKLAKELIRGSVKRFEETIDDDSIIRIHRSYLVNLQHLVSYKKTRKGYALTVQHVPDEIIPISSSYKQAFEDALKNKDTH
ncbi:LytR/AlgR family response regulator transcription factor [Snuella sedimenti]|uniref:LytTR family transcriptional regulator DNA-binding domain-containing protein n=1 Tax=Snuella sedimenti TaxID=2798802 RepID=A0A8J7IEK2_9FLAO|nr:LytTR family DNA-binding domain-containing protein [Snuella sedimenti]MBJ6366617.1 LytTR family transcriptional regulator DNA-binding domain-containing protein [Snuella sedimenti]